MQSLIDQVKSFCFVLFYIFPGRISKPMKYIIKWCSSMRLPASLVAQQVRNLPAVWETRVRSLGQEDPLEKGLATHFIILAWSIPWTEEPGGLQFMGSQRVRKLLILIWNFIFTVYFP